MSMKRLKDAAITKANALTAELADLTTRLASSEQRVQELSKEVTTLTDANQTLTEQQSEAVTVAETTAKAHTDEVTGLQQEIGTLTKEVATLKAAIADPSLIDAALIPHTQDILSADAEADRENAPEPTEPTRAEQLCDEEMFLALYNVADPVGKSQLRRERETALKSKKVAETLKK